MLSSRKGRRSDRLLLRRHPLYNGCYFCLAFCSQRIQFAKTKKMIPNLENRIGREVRRREIWR